jgi:hypothetical protein
MNAPYDGRFKILAEEYPELLLRLLGILKPGMKPQIVNEIRELQLDPVLVDHIYRITGEQTERLVHLEAITSWDAQRVSRLALYRLFLKHKYRLPVSSYLVLMARKYAPKRRPVKAVYEEPDGFRIQAPYQVIRLWKVDPAIAFEPGCEPLLPWVPLLKTGKAELERTIVAFERLAEHPKDAPYPMPVMVSNLTTLSGLRYDKVVIKQLLERLGAKIMLSPEIFKVSWLYKDGVADGKEQGKLEGLLEGKRDSLRLLLENRFPALSKLSEIDQITRLEDLDGLLLMVTNAREPGQVEIAIKAAVSVN